MGVGNSISNNGYQGIYIDSINDGGTVEILNNSITDNGWQSDYPGIYVNNVYDSILNIQNNSAISNNSGQGIYICSEGECQNSTLDISGNTIKNNSYQGIQLYSLTGSTLNVENNQILSNGDSGFELEYIGLSEESSDTSPSTASILSNTINTNGNYGIYIGETDSDSNITIGTTDEGKGNTISDNTNSGIYLNSNVTGVTITGNTITGNGTDEEEGEPVFTGIVVNSTEGNEAHQNIITGNVVGVQNLDLDNIFNAIENWWGSYLGPKGEGADSVSGNVLFDPWCFDRDCEHVFSTPPEGSLLEDVSYGLPPGATLEDTPSLTYFTEEIYTIAHAGGSSTVTIPEHVSLSRPGSVNYNAN